MAAVDTNQGKAGAWTTHIQLYRPDHEARVVYEAEGWTYTFTTDVDDAKERVGWCLAVGLVCANEAYPRDKSIVILTDAHRGEHDGINRRATPMLDALILPLGFALAYATSDKGEALVNQLMRGVDRKARTQGRHLGRVAIGQAAMFAETSATLWQRRSAAGRRR